MFSGFRYGNAMNLEKLGPFKVGRVLGRGGMGAVYEGTSDTDNSVVALKVLSDSLDADEDTEVRLRFESEIESLKRLHHPNIVRLSGFGEEQGQLYYVMELINGASLQQELRKKRLFQWHEVAKIGLDICSALRHAHDRGVIHRDIKPANILLDREGNVKLSDFGIARFFGSRQITDIHSVIGTLEYMSPEQALAHPINPSTDLYSLGCVLYVLLIGKPPFSARSLPEILRKHKSTTPAPIRSVRYDVPDDLGYVITDLLQIRSEDRPRNASLVAKRLQSLLQALMGAPETIKVLPMSPETPQQRHRSMPPSSDGTFHPDSYIQQIREDVDLDDIIDLGEVVKPDLPSGNGQILQNELLADSFKRIGEEYSTPELQTGAISSANSPVNLDSDKPESPKEISPLTATVTSLSALEHRRAVIFQEDCGEASSQPPIELQHGNVLMANTQTLRPAKDEPLPDAAMYWMESPIIRPEIVPSSQEKLSHKYSSQKVKADQDIPHKNVPEFPEVPIAQASPADSGNALTSLRHKTLDKTSNISGRFIAVTDKDFDPFEEEHRVVRSILSLPIILTSTMLMIVGLTVYYLLQPTSPEVLFERIAATIKDDDSADGYSLTLLKSAKKDIHLFLSIYSEHPAAEQVRLYQDEMDLLEHERRLERRTQFSSLRTLSPVERTYVEVLTSTPNNPEQTIDNLHSFIAVFQTIESLSEERTTPRRLASNPVEICVELAQRRLKKLERNLEEINEEQEQVIRRRLDEAVMWDSQDPVRANGIRRGIIKLYQNHRWAKELVEEARQTLEDM